MPKLLKRDTLEETFMVKKLVKIASREAKKAARKATSILFADPELLYKEERHLVDKPFFFPGTNGKGVLLVHGWTSTPYELRRLGKYLSENGYTTSGIMLSGHGTIPKDLEGIGYEKWIEDIQKGVEELRESCDKVYIAGTSIGASLALIAAQRDKDLAGLVLMATPYRMRLEPAALFVAKILLRLKKKYRQKWYPPTFGLSTTITRLISYQSYPVKSVLEAFRLVQEARKNLSAVTQPILVMQSTSDHIVAKDSLERIYEGVGSGVKRKKYIRKAYHTFISDIRNEHVFQDILDFLENN